MIEEEQDEIEMYCRLMMEEVELGEGQRAGRCESSNATTDQNEVVNTAHDNNTRQQHTTTTHDALHTEHSNQFRRNKEKPRLVKNS